MRNMSGIFMKDKKMKLNGNIMPTNILVDEDGSIAWMHYGYMPGDEINMEKEILKVLNQ